MQQETMLLHGTGLNGYYVFKALYYQLLLLKVTMYFSISEVLCQKQKPQIDGLLLCTLPGRRPFTAEGGERARLGRVHLYFLRT